MATSETWNGLKMKFDTRHKRALSGILLFLIALLVISRPDLVFGLEYLKIPMTKLAPFSTAELRGIKASLNIKLPVPSRWHVRKANLHFSYVNSSALVPERSKMTVRLNGHPLTQITLQPRSPSGELDLVLPAEYLLADYNDLDFFVSQDYTDECTDPGDPGLWTYIDLKNSYLELEYALEPIPLSLISVSEYLFDPKTLDNTDVHIVLERFDESRLRLAAITAAGVAMKYQYRPVRFTMSNAIEAGMDNVVVGERDFITALLESSSQDIPDGNLGLIHLPVGENNTDPTRALIVITGKDREELEKSVQAFSVMSHPMPDAAFTTVKEMKLPEIKRYSGKDLLAPGSAYYFHQLGFTSQTRSGMNPAPIYLDFRIPTDFLVKTNETMFLSLHMAYGAQMRADSVLNVLFNDVFTGAIPLDDTSGGNYLGYKVIVPNRLLKPGRNTVSFRPVLTPGQTGQCVYYQTENLGITLFDDSKITIPDMNHWVGMPNLELLFKDGFPMTKWPDWRETLVYLSDKSWETAAAAINLTAAICQKNRICPYGITFTYGNPNNGEKDILVVGSLDSIPMDLKAASPIAKPISYPLWTELPGTAKVKNWFEKLLPPDPQAPAGEHGGAEVVFESTLGDGKLLITGFESQVRASRSVILVTAREAQDLLSGTQELWDPGLQARITQSLAVINLKNAEKEVYSYRAGTDYYVGKTGKIGMVDHLIHTNPWLCFIVLIACLIIMAWIILLLIKRLRKKRLKSEEDAIPL